MSALLPKRKSTVMLCTRWKASAIIKLHAHGLSKGVAIQHLREKTAFNDYLASTTSERKQTDAVIAWCNAITTEEKCTDDCEYIHGAKPICIPTIALLTSKMTGGSFVYSVKAYYEMKCKIRQISTPKLFVMQ